MERHKRNGAGNCRKLLQTASGPTVEAVPGPTQLKFRTPDASLHFMHGGLRMEADCSTGGPWA
eukprot:8732295-Alexandrium_andersonii.AAC.1